jgi:hypothetical protein
MQEVLEKRSDERMEGLINLKFRRLEDLIYGLRREILQDRDIVSLLPAINGEFGSVRGLLEKYRQAVDTVDRLKVREFKYAEDELVKRRQLANCDVPTLHFMIVCLQNEVADLKSQLRVALAGGKVPSDLIDSSPDFDLVSEYNILEGRCAELQKRLDSVLLDNRVLMGEINLDKETLKRGIFRIDDQMRGLLEEANGKISSYESEIVKMQNLADIQMKMMTQFQKEKGVLSRQRIQLTGQMSELKNELTKAKCEVRTANRRLKAVRGLSRIVVEDSLSRRRNFAPVFERLNETFFQEFQRYDTAALIIQNAWRKRRSSGMEKEIVKRGRPEMIAQIMQMTAVDAVAGVLKPISYRQVINLLKGYTSDLKEGLGAQFSLVERFMQERRKKLGEAAEGVLCKGRRFEWVQTENDRNEMETQTEKTPPLKPPGKK